MVGWLLNLILLTWVEAVIASIGGTREGLGETNDSGFLDKLSAAIAERAVRCAELME